MSSRATLVAHASTPATAAAAFPRDEPLEPRGRERAAAAAPVMPRAVAWRHAPDRASAETAAALGIAAEPDDGLRGWDLGRWAGSTFDEVAAADPAAVQAWLSDPGAAPHGGEPLTALLDRVAGWLAAAPDGHVLAVCGPAVVRAAVVTVLGAPTPAFWRIDVSPLTLTDLRGGPGRWTVRTTGAPIVPLG